MRFKVGEEIIPLEIKIDKYLPYYYAGASGDYNAIHIDEEFAKKAGLGGIILQGLCTMAFACRAVIKDLDPGKLKKIKVRFSQVVRPLDVLTVKGQVSNVEGNLVTFDFVVENQKNEQVITNAHAVVEN